MSASPAVSEVTAGGILAQDDLLAMLEAVQKKEATRQDPSLMTDQCKDLEDGLQLMASAASLGLPTLKNGRGLPMKGTCGELRKFKCRNCCLLISKYFSHFEKPESFRVVECHHCQGKADLIENHEDEFDHTNAASAASY